MDFSINFKDDRDRFHFYFEIPIGKQGVKFDNWTDALSHAWR